MSQAIDLSRTSGLVDLGTHTFQVTDRSSIEMGGSGYEYWRLICQVISPGENQGKEVMHQLSLSPSARFKIDEFLDGIGAPKKGKWTMEQCVGLKFRASVTHETYEGKMKTAFESIIPQGDLTKSFEDQPSELATPDEALPDDVVDVDESEEPEETKASKPRGRF